MRTLDILNELKSLLVFLMLFSQMVQPKKTDSNYFGIASEEISDVQPGSFRYTLYLEYHLLEGIRKTKQSQKMNTRQS